MPHPNRFLKVDSAQKRAIALAAELREQLTPQDIFWVFLHTGMGALAEVGIETVIATLRKTAADLQRKTSTDGTTPPPTVEQTEAEKLSSCRATMERFVIGMCQVFDPITVASNLTGPAVDVLCRLKNREHAHEYFLNIASELDPRRSVEPPAPEIQS